MNKKLIVLLLSTSTLIFSSCTKDENPLVFDEESPLNLPITPFNYSNINLPSHLTTNVLQGPGQNAAVDNDNTPQNNPVTDQGATLGRVLFYDENLSFNSTISCASCHQQENGFSDDRILSLGFEGGSTRRHSMSLINARWYERGRFFWDERAATLEDQVLEPFQDPVEMGMTLNQVVDRVQEASYYPQLFVDAFGSEEVNSEKIALALAQFIRSIVSIDSKYDDSRSNVNDPIMNFPGFTASENNGKRIFFSPPNRAGGGCIGCHSSEAFINPDNGTTNNGLDEISSADLGVFEALSNPRFLGTFKVPSLKSIALTAPYMHDGRFATLEEVVEHYNTGVQDHPNLAPVLRDNNGNPRRLNLSEEDKADLVAFLRTLTDNEVANDERFSDPFR